MIEQLKPYTTHIILLLWLLVGALMMSGPHFPNSDVSEEKNKDAFYALTILGTLITIPALIWVFMIFQVNLNEYFQKPDYQVYSESPMM